MKKIEIIPIVERVGSVFSLVGSLFIILTFFLCKAFHKPINRLVFYASFGNILSNVATLMATDFLPVPLSPPCQFQAFLIQMFMPADALWTLAMAVNVYLTFYYKFDAESLRRMDLWYILFCYGVPFIPALVFIFIADADGNRFYGDAVIWCWVDRSWNIFRIVTFYAPVWLVMILTVAIYTRAGGDIYRKRQQLRDFNSDGSVPTGPDMLTLKTTEVKVTSETAEMDNLSPTSQAIHSQTEAQDHSANDGAYSITISSRAAQKPADRPTTSSGQPDLGLAVPNTQPGQLAARRVKRPNPTMEVNRAIWSYTKCALLFFTAMIVTWMPSSANRLYSLTGEDKTSMVLEVMSAMVLPLQGFWNALIYIVTSWAACQQLRVDILNWAAAAMTWGREQKSRAAMRTSDSNGGHHHHRQYLGSKHGNGDPFTRSRSSKFPPGYASESVTELAGSQTSQHNDRSSSET